MEEEYKPKTRSYTLADALPMEIKRCEELLECYREIGPAASFASAMLSADIEAAKKAISDQDIVARLASYTKLKEAE